MSTTETADETSWRSRRYVYIRLAFIIKFVTSSDLSLCTGSPRGTSFKMKSTAVTALLSALALSEAANLPERQSSEGTATVNLTDSIGEPEFLGSGFIYGWPDNGTSASNAIPDYLVAGFKFNACRAGGAQIAAPGWAYGGYDGYIGRFNSTLSNYLTTRKYGGEFILLPHDLWGAQGGADSTTPFPGDNGNWTEMEVFLTQVVEDLKANNMLDDLIVDLWNEPDLTGFWDRPWSQYVEYYVRATQFVRQAPIPYPPFNELR